MLQAEPITNFNGFGIGQGQGEYFHSQGMNRTLFGVTPRWNIVEDVNQSTLTNLQTLNWFSQGNLGGALAGNFVYGFAPDGRLYKRPFNATTWTEEFLVNFVSSHGNGLIFDQTNRLLFASDQYLGRFDGNSYVTDWKDFGLSQTTTDFRPMDTYEDWVAIGNKNQIALLNVTDDSWNSNGFNLPTGFNIRCVKSGRTGILIGANFNNRGVLILWEPNYTRSIAPWIWRNSNIQSIVPTDDGWIVITQQDIFKTNGYSIDSILTDFPDHLINDSGILSNVLPQGAEIEGDTLYFWGTSGRFNRQKSGLYILDLTTKLMEFAPVSSGATYNVTGGAIFFDKKNFISVSYSSVPGAASIGRVSNSNPSRASLITQQLGTSDNEKVAEGVKFTFGINPSQVLTTDITFDVSVKITRLKRNLFGYAQTRAASTLANILNIDGSLSTSGLNRAQIGDEVTILQGINAGQVRHISAIANQGTNTETWTLDSALPNNTENLVYMNVSPFKFVHKYSFSNASELKELYFNVQDRIKGKKFLVKLLLENMTSGLMLELKSGQFIYDELSIKR